MENAAKDGYSYDADAIVMPVKCTGLVKVSYLLKLFARGMQGVLVLGCRDDDCRYYNGSERCGKIVEETREILDLAGIPSDRLQFHSISDSQGKEFRSLLKSFLRQFKKASTKSPAKGGKAKRGGAGKTKAGKGRSAGSGAKGRSARKRGKRGTSGRHK
jgi:coenzyme F420-reducing hydrogenase delta subunit